MGIVKSVKERQLLLPVARIVGGIDVDHHPLGRPRGSCPIRQRGDLLGGMPDALTNPPGRFRIKLDAHGNRIIVDVGKAAVEGGADRHRVGREETKWEDVTPTDATEALCFQQGPSSWLPSERVTPVTHTAHSRKTDAKPSKAERNML